MSQDGDTHPHVVEESEEIVEEEFFFIARRMMRSYYRLRNLLPTEILGN